MCPNALNSFVNSMGFCSPRQLEFDDEEVAVVSWKDDNSSTWAIGGVNNMNSELTEGFDSMDGDWCKIHIACIR